MKAIYALIPDKEQLVIESEELDPNDADGAKILVEAECTIMSGGTELAAFTALSKSVYKKDGWNAYPWRPGYGLVGHVRAAGPRARGFRAGDRIFCFGKHASHQWYDLDSPKPFRAAFPIADDLPAERAVIARLALVSMTALQVGRVRAGDSVYVIGMGLVGNLAAQLYRIAGLEVRVWDTSEGRRAVAKGVGLEVASPDAVGPSDVTVDAVGSGEVVEQCVNLTKPHGEVVLLGSPRPPYETDLTAVFNRIHMQWLTVRGALEWRLPPYPIPGGGPSVASNLALILDHIRAGRIRTEGLVSHHIGPDGLLDAYRGMQRDPDHHHGVVVDWRVF